MIMKPIRVQAVLESRTVPLQSPCSSFSINDQMNGLNSYEMDHLSPPGMLTLFPSNPCMRFARLVPYEAGMYPQATNRRVALAFIHEIVCLLT
jgi:hypothetical protein